MCKSGTANLWCLHLQFSNVSLVNSALQTFFQNCSQIHTISITQTHTHTHSPTLTHKNIQTNKNTHSNRSSAHSILLFALPWQVLNKFNKSLRFVFINLIIKQLWCCNAGKWFRFNQDKIKLYNFWNAQLHILKF